MLFTALIFSSYECTDELALTYLEIFEDDVESAVTAFLESEPPQKRYQSAQQHVEDTDGRPSKEPQSPPRLEEVRA